MAAHFTSLTLGSILLLSACGNGAIKQKSAPSTNQAEQVPQTDETPTNTAPSVESTPVRIEEEPSTRLGTKTLVLSYPAQDAQQNLAGVTASAPRRILQEFDFVPLFDGYVKLRRPPDLKVGECRSEGDELFSVELKSSERPHLPMNSNDESLVIAGRNYKVVIAIDNERNCSHVTFEFAVNFRCAARSNNCRGPIEPVTPPVENNGEVSLESVVLSAQGFKKKAELGTCLRGLIEAASLGSTEIFNAFASTPLIDARDSSVAWVGYSTHGPNGYLGLFPKKRYYRIEFRSAPGSQWTEKRKELSADAMISKALVIDEAEGKVVFPLNLSICASKFQVE